MQISILIVSKKTGFYGMRGRHLLEIGGVAPWNLSAHSYIGSLLAMEAIGSTGTTSPLWI